jgi:hypothetical protein
MIKHRRHNIAITAQASRSSPQGLAVIAPKKTTTQMGALHCGRDDSRKAKVSGELYALCDDIDEYAIKGNLVGLDPCRAVNSSLCSCDIRNDCP